VGVVSDGNTGEKNGSYPNLRPAWRPGETGNPGGRSMSLVNLAWEARRATDGGRELIKLQLSIARGEEIPVPGRARGQRPTLDQRQQAIEWLANRGWGKAKEYIELTGEASPEQRLELLRRLSDEDRAQLRGLLAKALRGTSPPDDAPALPTPTDLEEPTTWSTSTATGHDLEETASDLPPPDTTN
jgi:DNA-binding MarR family transcriptional regulator